MTTVSRAVVEGSAGQMVEGRFAIGRAFLVSVRKVVVARGREHKTAHSGCVIMTTTVEVGDGEGLGRLSK